MTTADPLVWIDCEMTGLDLGVDALIEVAVIVTDYDLKPLEKGIDVLIRPPAAALEQMGDFVREMHTSSGLLDELEEGLTTAEARRTVLEYVRSLVPQPRTAQLAGNSVGTDKAFLTRDMPQLIDYLHYRVVDVSSIKELAKRWYPRTFFHSPEKHGGHRALADILSRSTNCATTADSSSPPARARRVRSAGRSPRRSRRTRHHRRSDVRSVLRARPRQWLRTVEHRCAHVMQRTKNELVPTRASR